jgi:hypothetical protein
MPGDQPFKLRDQLLVAAERELVVDQVELGSVTLLLEAGDFIAALALEQEPSKWRPAP